MSFKGHVLVYLIVLEINILEGSSEISNHCYFISYQVICCKQEFSQLITPNTHFLMSTLDPIVTRPHSQCTYIRTENMYSTRMVLYSYFRTHL